MAEWFLMFRMQRCEATSGLGQDPAVIAGGNGIMGKGDKRSKRGKLFKGTFGKWRVKPQKKAKQAKAAAAAGGA
jgi:30S ribosomal protein S31